MHQNKTIEISVSGKSMFPLISSGDKVVVTVAVPITLIRVGDIVVLRSNIGGYFAHRVLKNIDGILTTKGDFNQNIDTQQVTEKSYIGKVVGIQNEAFVFKNIIFESRLIKNIFLLYSFLMGASLIRPIIFNLVHNYSFYEFFVFVFATREKQPNDSNSTDFLLHLLKHKDEQCTWDFTRYKVDENRLFTLVEHNKSLLYLEHIVECANCNAYFSSQLKAKIKKLTKNNLYILWQKKQISKKLSDIAKKNNIPLVFLKTVPDKFEQQHPAYDVDVLVKKSAVKRLLAVLFSQGYAPQCYPPHEVPLENNQHKIILDIHFLSSIPRKLIFSKQKTKNLSKYLLDNSVSGKLKVEDLVFSSIVRFWTNDLFHGARKLFDILKLVSDQNFNWNYFVKLCNKYSFYPEAILTLQVANRLANMKLPATVKKQLFQNKKINLLAHYFSLQRVLFFQKRGEWWDENNYFSRKFLIELYVLRLALRADLFSMMFQPRVLSSFIISIKRRVFG